MWKRVSASDWETTGSRLFRTAGIGEAVWLSATSQLGPETFAEARSVQALAALLDALGTTGRPVLVLLDDCQWADQLTLKVLSNWQRRPECRSVRSSWSPPFGRRKFRRTIRCAP